MDIFKKILIFVYIIFAVNIYCFAHNNNDNCRTNTDTVTALVISPNNPFYTNLSNYSGNQILSIIDSILDLDNIPLDLLKTINDYAESRLFKHNYYNSITYFNDNSKYPSNALYKKWDTKNISPYNETSINDTSLYLRLVDTNNFCGFNFPLDKTIITSNYGWRKGRMHTGIDLDLQVWDPVYAAFDGMVRIAFYHPGYGRVVVIRHYNGLETLYAHLHRFKVKSGDIVEAGQVIGLGGSSGHSTGSHLHFEVRFKGKPLNPKNIISFKENKLISDSLELIKHKWDYVALPVGVKYYTIQRGDFMYKIANRYGMSVNELCNLNDMKRNKVLIVGKKLRIK